MLKESSVAVDQWFGVNNPPVRGSSLGFRFSHSPEWKASAPVLVLRGAFWRAVVVVVVVVLGRVFQLATPDSQSQSHLALRALSCVDSFRFGSIVIAVEETCIEDPLVPVRLVVGV